MTETSNAQSGSSAHTSVQAGEIAGNVNSTDQSHRPQITITGGATIGGDIVTGNKYVQITTTD